MARSRSRGRFRADLDLSTYLDDLSSKLADPPEQADPTEPILAGTGDPTFSTCVAVEPWPTITWDVNGYYFELGVHHRATRAELRVAYQAKQGHRSERLTYILSQLLDPETRRAYDATSPDHVFVDDYVLWEVRKHSIRQQVRERLERHLRGEPERLVEMLDWDAVLGQDEPSSRTNTWRGTSTFAHYVLGTVEDPYRAREWRDALTAELGGRGISLTICAGLATGLDAPSAWRWVGDRLVAFLGDAEVGPAARALSTTPIPEDGATLRKGRAT